MKIVKASEACLPRGGGGNIDLEYEGLASDRLSFIVVKEEELRSRLVEGIHVRLRSSKSLELADWNGS